MSPDLLNDFLAARTSLKMIEDDISLVLHRFSKFNAEILQGMIPPLLALQSEAHMAVTRLDNEFEAYMKKHYGGKNEAL